LLTANVEAEMEVASSVEFVEQHSTEETDQIKANQIMLLAGRTTTKDIFSREGELLFPNGTTLNKEDVKKAQEKGPAVLADLSMNVVG
jgi:hypothetical protein